MRSSAVQQNWRDYDEYIASILGVKIARLLLSCITKLCDISVKRLIFGVWSSVVLIRPDGKPRIFGPGRLFVGPWLWSRWNVRRGVLVAVWRM